MVVAASRCPTTRARRQSGVTPTTSRSCGPRRPAIANAIEAHKSALDELTGLPVGHEGEGRAAGREGQGAQHEDLRQDDRARTRLRHAAALPPGVRRAASQAHGSEHASSAGSTTSSTSCSRSTRGTCAWRVPSRGWRRRSSSTDERTQGTDAESALIDDVLRCSKPKKPPKPPADDTDDVDELDPCRHVDRAGPEPEPEPGPAEPEPDPYGGGGREGRAGTTGQYPRPSRPRRPAAPTQQAPPTGRAEPPSGESDDGAELSRGSRAAVRDGPVVRRGRGRVPAARRPRRRPRGRPRLAGGRRDRRGTPRWTSCCTTSPRAERSRRCVT